MACASTSIRLPEQLRQQVAARAAVEHRTVAGLIRALVADGLEAREQAEAPRPRQALILVPTDLPPAA